MTGEFYHYEAAFANMLTYMNAGKDPSPSDIILRQQREGRRSG